MPEGVVIDIINIIDRLETLIETSKTVPVSGNILMEKKKVLELVDQLRLTVPEEVRNAEDVLAQKDQIISIAQTDARRTKSMAEDELRDRLNQHELVAQAEMKAAQTIREAEERATRMLQQSEAESQSRRTDADAYALRSLRTLEAELSSISGSVRKGIDLMGGNATAHLNMQYLDEEPRS